jgi:hypothetical protein
MGKVTPKESKVDSVELMLKIMRNSKNRDREEAKKGNVLKYVFEMRGDDNQIEDVVCAYTEAYYKNDEIAAKSGLNNKKFTIRGPFPIVEGGISDSKINRWREEKEKSKNDDFLIKSKIKETKKAGFKYIYLIFDCIFDVERFASFMTAKKALEKRKIQKLLGSSVNRKIKRINLFNNQEKIYECET